MKRTYVGTYWLTGFRVKLYLEPGAEFSSCISPTEACPYAEMVICTTEYDSRFGNVLACLIHESVEFCLARAGAQHRSTVQFKESTADVLFVHDHHAFDQATARAGIFIGECLDAVRAKWKKGRGRK